MKHEDICRISGSCLDLFPYTLSSCSVKSQLISGDDTDQSPLFLVSHSCVTSHWRLRPVISFVSSSQCYLGRPLPLHSLPILIMIEFSSPSPLSICLQSISTLAIIDVFRPFVRSWCAYYEQSRGHIFCSGTFFTYSAYQS